MGTDISAFIERKVDGVWKFIPTPEAFSIGLIKKWDIHRS